jgi:hypothetical protein
VVYSTALFGRIGDAATETVSVTLDDLEPDTTFYYRLCATNADGTTCGADQSFTTPGFPSPLVQPATPPLLAIPAIAFPTETTGLRGTKALTSAQKLAKALKACNKDRSRSKRASCEKQARKKYGPGKKGAKK